VVWKPVVIEVGGITDHGDHSLHDLKRPQLLGNTASRAVTETMDEGIERRIRGDRASVPNSMVGLCDPNAWVLSIELRQKLRIVNAIECKNVTVAKETYTTDVDDSITVVDFFECVQHPSR